VGGLLLSSFTSLSREERVERNRDNMVPLTVFSRARNIPPATSLTRGGVAIFVFVTKRTLFLLCLKTFFNYSCVDFL